MTYEELTEKRYQLTIELAGIERELLKYNGATLFVDKRKNRKAKKITLAMPLPEDWWPSKELLIQAKMNISGLDLGTETTKFKNYYRANGKKMKDWEASWKNWLINASQYQEARR